MNRWQADFNASNLPEADLLTLAKLHCESGMLYRQGKALFSLQQVRSYQISRHAGDYMGLQAAFVSLGKDVAWVLGTMAVLWLLSQTLAPDTLAGLRQTATVLSGAWLLLVVLVFMYAMVFLRKQTRPPQTEHFRLYAYLGPSHTPCLICATQSKRSLQVLQQCLQTTAKQ